MRGVGRPPGNVNAAQFLLIVPRLRSLAHRLLARERPGHTLQATALVNEVFLKLSFYAASVVDQRHLFNLCARAMRQVLIDHGRARSSRVVLEDVASSLASVASTLDAETLVAIRTLFLKLEQNDPIVATTLRLRFVEGWKLPEISDLQNRAEWRVRADCDFGLKWMRSNLTTSPRVDSDG